METLLALISEHARYAHWYAFAAILLAGFGIPISIDAIFLLCAILAATVIPEHTWLLFAACTSGALLAAWIAYWFGRLLGKTVLHKPFFAKLLPPHRLDKAKSFYERHGLKAFLVGRFIPFGARICLFMSSGISRMPFGQFIWKEAISCLTWSSIVFFLFYSLGQNYQVLYHYLKTFNVVVFSIFGIALTAFIWIKKRKSLRKRPAKEVS